MTEKTQRATLKAGQNAIPTDFEGIRLSVASPDDILSWSFGEVTKPETINYRTQKPERDGLFDERIFGPVKDYECYCGKYKKIRYKGIVCDRCGVEITRSSVRRERMGHIDLSVPVVHIWYLHGVPSILSTLLDVTISDLEAIIYFAAFIVIDVDEKVRELSLSELEKEYQALRSRNDIKDNPIAVQRADLLYKQRRNELLSLAPKLTLSETQYHDISMKYGQIVKVGIGAEAILELLHNTDVDKSISELEKKLKFVSDTNRKKTLRQLRLYSDMKKAKIKPEWLVMSRLPVIPPDLRPMVQLDGGRFATSDLNDLYRRVLNRNNRLKRLIKQNAPEVICRNEKRMLQEAVDALIDNSAKRGRAATIGAQRKLRSLSDILRGKQGRFRQNLLGKRVDYSGRSVIVIGPKLKLHQCGLPKVMAIELFKTFVISKLINDGYVHNVKNASRMIERGEPIVWDILEQVTKEYHVLINRAPTLHRLGIQAFQPVLIEGKAIQIHPSVCYAFNADFDGDQMAVHIPLSTQARNEAANIMLSSKNLLKPASGEPVISPRLDIVLGCFYLTGVDETETVAEKLYGSKNEAIMAYQQGDIKLRSRVYVRISDKVDTDDSQKTKSFKDGKTLVATTVGRILFNNIIPDKLGYHNVPMDSSTLKKIIARTFKEYGAPVTAELVDKINGLGFTYATLSGVTISMDDIYTPENKKQIIADTNAKVDKIETLYRQGLITDDEKRTKTIELWLAARDTLEKAMIDGFNKQSPVWITVASGARGSVTQLVQMSGMKGNVVNPAGKIIELPIISNYKEGLSVLEYFISTHGSRKGKSDTALRTSDAGYLTRRLVDVAQDIVIVEGDCGTKKFMTVRKADYGDDVKVFISKISGRVAAQTIKDVVKKGNTIDLVIADKIANDAKVQEVAVRSVIYCETSQGVCQNCYGNDMATGALVVPGTTVGTIAAQAIGEPGTQLTMKTFHMGGITGADITSGLPRVEELFESRSPRTPATVSEIDGIVDIVTVKGRKYARVSSDEKRIDEIEVPEGHEIAVKSNEMVKSRQILATREGKKTIRATVAGRIRVKGSIITILSDELRCEDYEVHPDARLLIKPGEKIVAGQALTEGHLDLAQSLRLNGAEFTQNYIISEVRQIYASQGQEINDKHVEIIVKQMFSKLTIVNEGDSDYIPGQIVDKSECEEAILNSKSQKKTPPAIVPAVLGITRVALKTDSFLSAASFQETTNVLIDAAIRGAVDRLHGLKENVIIGKLIPAGTGYKPVKIKKDK